MNSLGQNEKSVTFEVQSEGGAPQENVPIIAVSPEGKVLGRGMTDSSGIGVVVIKGMSLEESHEWENAVMLVPGKVGGCELSISPVKQEATVGDPQIYRFIIGKKALIRGEVLFVGAAAFIAGVLIRELQEFTK